METKVEEIRGPGGAVAYAVTVGFQGREFTAGGGLVDEANGVVVGYPVRRKDPGPGESFMTLNVAGGSRPVMGLRLVSTFSRRVPSTGAPVLVSCWSGVLSGRRYSGRNSGEGMLLTMRAGRKVRAP